MRFGDRIDAETHRKVQKFVSCLDKHPFPGLVEYVPAFTSVTVFYDGFQIYRESQSASPFAIVRDHLLQMASNLGEGEERSARTVEIPVCYGGEFGPDLEEVARHNRLSAEQVIDIHSGGEYLVYMLGFAPGFPYLGGLSAQIAAPRRATPRLSIPAGTVGIAGMQTGVYPIETPGGWQLIGRTPARLFRPREDPPTLLRAGDLVKFVPITRSEYDHWKEVAR